MSALVAGEMTAFVGGGGKMSSADSVVILRRTARANRIAKCFITAPYKVELRLVLQSKVGAELRKASEEADRLLLVAERILHST